jgi:hypothetical protein
MMTWDGIDSGDYVSHGIYLSSGKLLVVIVIVAILVVVAFHEGRKNRDGQN